MYAHEPHLDEGTSDAGRARTWCPHVTVASVVHDAGRFLMVEEHIGDKRLYNQPAGHLEPGESLLDAAVRETLEETGWDVALTGFLGVQQWRSPVYDDDVVRFAFCAEPLRQHPERALDEGICQALWLSRDSIAELSPQLRSPLVMLTVDTFISGRRLPLDTLTCLLDSAPGQPTP